MKYFTEHKYFYMIKLNNIRNNSIQQEASLANNIDIVYSDLKLDLKTEYTKHNQIYKKLEQKDLVLSFNEEAIQNSLSNLFNTVPGQKILIPEYGLDLKQFLFQPLNEFYAQSIGETILASIRLYENRISVTNINVYPDVDNLTYEINIYYTIPKFSNKVFNFYGQLTQNGFIY